MRRLLVACLVLAGVPALAELRGSAADGFAVSHVFSLSKDRQAVYDALGHPEHWWPSDHTWSGKAANLSLEPRAGGCFCEAWEGGSAEHGRVVMAVPGERLRLVGAFGPLQEMAVAAVLTVTLEAEGEGGTRLRVTYRISGDPSHALGGLAPGVDGVIAEQFGRLARYVNGGRVD